MKNLTTIFCAMLISSCCFYTAGAQTKGTKLAAMLDNRNYIFNANFVNPMRGGGRNLTSEYDVSVSKDTIVAYLPYFGQAYLANYGGTDNGIKFTWTHFGYKDTPGKKGNREILITPTDPKDKNAGDPLGVQSLRLSISTDGYASLQVTNFNRDPISFNGTIEPKGKGTSKLQAAAYR